MTPFWRGRGEEKESKAMEKKDYTNLCTSNCGREGLR